MLNAILSVILARMIPRGIVGVVLASIILAFGLVGTKEPMTLLLLFLLPVLISTFATPECITPSTPRNREFYGSSFNMCSYVLPYHSHIFYIRILGELLYIGSAYFYSYILAGMGITIILIEMLFYHPVPLLEREFIPYKLHRQI